MKQISPQNFLQGVEQGYIIDVFAVGRRVYGKDPRGLAGSGKTFEVVYADIP